MPRLLPSSLTGRLVATAVALVALVSVLLAVATTAVLRSYLNGQLDGELTEAAARAVGAYRGGPAFPRHDEDGGRPGGREDHEGPEIESAFGQASGTVTAYLTDLGLSGEVITSEGERDSLDDEVLDEARRGARRRGSAHGHSPRAGGLPGARLWTPAAPRW